jgi:hypothetical protein
VLESTEGEKILKSRIYKHLTLYNNKVPFVSWVNEIKNKASLYNIGIAKANFKLVEVLFFKPET